MFVNNLISSGFSGVFTACVEITGLDSQSGEVRITASPEPLNSEPHACEIKTRLAVPSLTGAYNLAATIAAASASGVDIGDAARALDGYELKSGRTRMLSVGGRDCMLLISKHENSLSYNQSLAWAAGRGKPCTVLIFVDSISRKYYTSETSWLWDVDFDILSADTVKDIAFAGRYSNELMTRFAMTAVDPGKYRNVGDLESLREYAGQCGTEDMYVITCFADRSKLLKAFGTGK